MNSKETNPDRLTEEFSLQLREAWGAVVSLRKALHDDADRTVAETSEALSATKRMGIGAFNGTAETLTRKMEVVNRKLTTVLGKVSPYGHAGWSDPAWIRDLVAPSGGAACPAALAVGTNAVRLTGSSELPVLLDPLHRHLLVTHDGSSKSRSAANLIAQEWSLRFLLSAAPGRFRMHLFDPEGLGQNLGPLNRLHECLLAAPLSVKIEDTQRQLDALAYKVNQVNSRILYFPDDTLAKFWDQGKALGEAGALAVVTGLPRGSMGRSVGERLASLAQTGTRCGTYLTLVMDVSGKDGESDLLAGTGEEFYRVEVSDHGQSITVHGTPHSLPPRLKAPSPIGQAQLDLANGSFKDKVLAGDAKTLELLPALLSEEPYAHISRDEIVIPIGENIDGSFAEIRIGDSDASAIGALLVGPSGSGKTTLLHSLIHAAAYRYSPAELEIYLLDLKGGIEFNEYASAPQLPHLRAVGIDPEPYFAVGVMDHLISLDADRKELFKKASNEFGKPIRDLKTYRSITGRAMPRILLIADEYQLMFSGDTEDQAWASMEVLAKQGRSQGIHVLLSTQSLRNIGAGRRSQRDSIFAQMGLRIGLRATREELSLLMDRTSNLNPGAGKRGSGVMSYQRDLDSADVPFQAAVLDDSPRADLRSKLISLSPPDSCRVSHGAEGSMVSDVVAAVGRVQGPSLILGAPVGVTPPVETVPMVQDSGRGVLLVCRDEQLGVDMVCGMVAASVLLGTAVVPRVVVLDCLPEGSPAKATVNALQASLAGVMTSVSTVTDAQEALQADAGLTKVFVVLGLHHLGLEAPGYGDKEDHPANILNDLYARGSGQSIYPVVWQESADNRITKNVRTIQYRMINGSVEESRDILDIKAPFPAPRGRFWFRDLKSGGKPRLIDPWAPLKSDIMAIESLASYVKTLNMPSESH